MTKRLIAGLLAAVMMISSAQFPYGTVYAAENEVFENETVVSETETISDENEIETAEEQDAWADTVVEEQGAQADTVVEEQTVAAEVSEDNDKDAVNADNTTVETVENITEDNGEDITDEETTIANEEVVTDEETVVSEETTIAEEETTEQVSGEEAAETEIECDDADLTGMYGVGYNKNDPAFIKAVNTALSNVNDSMSDFQKAVVLHDWIALHCVYKFGDDSAADHTRCAYGPLVDGYAVCAGYADAYQYLLNKIGIECYVVSSDKINHAWNLVRLGGKYYHADVTWDDIDEKYPLYEGMVEHKYLLCSDADFEKSDTKTVHETPERMRKEYDVHEYRWSLYKPMADSALYDNASWKKIQTPIEFDDKGEIITEPKTYTITYVLNGGTNSSKNPSTHTNQKMTWLYDPMKNGYRFGGWYKDAQFTVEVPNNGKGNYYIPQGAKDCTIYAKWIKDETVKIYTITYVLNGGTNNSKNPSTYTTGTEVTFKDPVREGYQFDGWYSDANFTKKVTTLPKDSSGNKTVYAKWTKTETFEEGKTYTITYVLNGGTNSSNNPASYISGKGAWLADPVKTGYQFDGWYADAQFTKQVSKGSQGYYIAANAYGNKTIYAKWTKIETPAETEVYTITYVLNGGTNNSENPSSYVKYADIWLKDPVRTGYQFDGWYSDADFTNRVATRFCNTAQDFTFYAKWIKIEIPEIKTHTITYVLNGGTNNSENPATYTEGTEVWFKDPVREGYQFDGWYMDLQFTRKVISLSKNCTDDYTIYAKWIKIEISSEETSEETSSEEISEETSSEETSSEETTEEASLEETSSEETSETETTTEIQPESFRVTFSTNGRGTAPEAYTGIETGSTITKPADPTADGYRFGGWYKNAACTKAWNFESDTVQADTTLYAKWIYEGNNELDAQDIPDMYYTGSACRPEVNVYDDETLLKAGKDYQIKYYNNVNANFGGVLKNDSFNAALPYAEITGKGNYTGTVRVNFNILKASISDEYGNPAGDVVLKVTDSFAASNKQKKPFSSIKLCRTMKQGVDFTLRLTASDGTELSGAVIPAGMDGTFTLEIIGMNNYEGAIERIIYVADKASLPKNEKFTANTIGVDGITDKVYTGKALVQENVRLFYGGRQLERGMDYTVSYKKNVNKGTATMTFRGLEKAGFSGSFKKTFRIVAADITTADYTENLSASYSKAGAKPAVRLTSREGTRLVNGRDYTLSYANNKAVGSGMVVVKGKGNYTGSFSIPFSIVKADLNDITVKTVPVAYDAKKAADYAYEPVIKLMDGKTALRAGVDYEIAYQNNTQAEYDAYRNGRMSAPLAVITAKEGSPYKLDGRIVIPLPVYQNKFTKNNVSVKVEQSECVYTGRQVKPSVEVRFMGVLLTEGRDYTVSYGENKVSGRNKGSVTISGIGPNYGGDVVVKFEIYRKPIQY